MNLSARSWHFWLASLAGHYRTNTDICTYTRAVLVGMLCLLMAALVGAMVIYCVGDFVAWVFAPADTLIGLGAFAFALFGSLALMIGTIFFIVAGIIKVSETAPTSVRFMMRDTFVESAWEAFKEKTCVRVVLK